jgi:hypothetical protein
MASVRRGIDSGMVPPAARKTRLQYGETEQIGFLKVVPISG